MMKPLPTQTLIAFIGLSIVQSQALICYGMDKESPGEGVLHQPIPRPYNGSSQSSTTPSGNPHQGSTWTPDRLEQKQKSQKRKKMMPRNLFQGPQAYESSSRLTPPTAETKGEAPHLSAPAAPAAPASTPQNYKSKAPSSPT